MGDEKALCSTTSGTPRQTQDDSGRMWSALHAAAVVKRTSTARSGTGESVEIKKTVNAAGEKFAPACTYYLQGRCDKGDDCLFYHPEGREGEDATTCSFFLKGRCTKGSSCPFSHGRGGGSVGGGAKSSKVVLSSSSAGRAPTAVTAGGGGKGGFSRPMCTFFLKGRCTKGSSCTFSHGQDSSGAGSKGQGKSGKGGFNPARRY